MAVAVSFEFQNLLDKGVGASDDHRVLVGEVVGGVVDHIGVYALYSPEGDGTKPDLDFEVFAFLEVVNVVGNVPADYVS